MAVAGKRWRGRRLVFPASGVLASQGVEGLGAKGREGGTRGAEPDREQDQPAGSSPSGKRCSIFLNKVYQLSVLGALIIFSNSVKLYILLQVLQRTEVCAHMSTEGPQQCKAGQDSGSRDTAAWHAYPAGMSSARRSELISSLCALQLFTAWRHLAMPVHRLTYKRHVRRGAVLAAIFSWTWNLRKVCGIPVGESFCVYSVLPGSE